ncbi:unnamed protein product [Caretta caretta]
MRYMFYMLLIRVNRHEERERKDKGEDVKQGRAVFQESGRGAEAPNEHFSLSDPLLPNSWLFIFVVFME